MSVFYGVRLSDELSAKIEATGRGKSEVITAAVGAYFHLDVVGTNGGKATVETVQPVVKPKRAKVFKAATVKRDLLDVALALAASGVEESTEEPAVSSGCRKHPGGPGWGKSGGWWCVPCGRIV